MTMMVPERVKIVLDMLTRAANAHDPCPTNDEICGRIASSSPATAARCISLLEVSGVISVERGAATRVVTITATGMRTAGDIRIPRVYAQASKKKMRKRYDEAWSHADDGLLMDRIAEGDDFEQASFRVGKTAEMCAARFDFLAREFDARSYALEGIA